MWKNRQIAGFSRRASANCMKINENKASSLLDSVYNGSIGADIRTDGPSATRVILTVMNYF